MAYMDLDKRRETTKKRVQSFRLKQRFDKYRNEDGKIDAKAFLEDNIEFILSDLLNPGKGIPSRKSEMILKILAVYSDKQEVTHKVEFTVNDRQEVAIGLLDALRREGQDTGICPICGQHKALRTNVLLSPKPEQENGGEVAALAVPA